MPLTRKLLLGVLAILSTVAAVVAVTMTEARARLEAAARNGLEESGRLEAARIDDRLDVLESDLRALLATPSLRAAIEDGEGSASLDESAVLAVRQARALGADVRSLAILRPDGEVLGSSEQLPAVDPVLLSGAPEVPIYGRSRRVAEGDDRLLVAQRLNGEPAAVGVVEFDLAPFRRMVRTHEGIGETGEAHLAQNVDGAAEFITPQRFREEDVSFALVVGAEQAAMPIIQSLDAPRTRVVAEKDYRGERTLAAVRTIDRTGWGLVVKIDESEALASVSSVSRLLVTGWAIAFIGAVLGVWVVMRHLRHRVESVKQAATAIGAGDLDRRIGPSGSDEIGEIAAAIDQMAESLAADRRRREEAEAVLSHQARHDQLTGLPNRAAALGALHAALLAHGSEASVLFLDLDGFKAVNDRYGHDGGDQLLVTIADRIRRCVPSDYLVARFGGDEFLVITTAAEAPALAEQLRRTVNRPIDIGVAVTEIDLSIGVATAGDHTSADLLVRDADLAMYRAKQERRSNQGDRPLELDGPTLDELRAALARDELSVAYQPIVDLEQGRTIGVEALARWDHPRLGPLDAGRWIPLARAAGLLGHVDRANITAAIAQLSEWRAAGLLERDFVLSVNLASESVPSVIDELGDELFAHNVPPHQLQVEITEEDFGDRREHIERRLWSLHRLGARLAIDDFGIVHSNLDRLRRLPVSTIKIDQSFVRDLPRSDEDRAIVRAVLAMSSELGITVVAEGVEDPSQADELRALGCRLAQGFHLGTPQPAPELTLVAG